MDVIIFVAASILLVASSLMQVGFAISETRVNVIPPTICFLATVVSVLIMASTFEALK